MPTYDSLKNIYRARGFTNGQVRKSYADDLVNNTWYEDVASRVVYLYDYKHDDTPTMNIGMKSDKDKLKIPVDAKFIVAQTQSLSKDQVEFHLQFRPNQKPVVPYYKDVFADKYWSEYPIGLYVDIPDNEGVFRRWLIVNKANGYDPQFLSYMILPCDWYAKWVYKNVKYRMWACGRSQNS